jgi:hypothetical protein
LTRARRRPEGSTATRIEAEAAQLVPASAGSYTLVLDDNVHVPVARRELLISVVPRDDDPEGLDAADRPVPVDATLAQYLRAVESEVDGYLQHQTSEHLRALEEALARLDAQTADSDAWIAGVTNTASWGVDAKGTVVGETGSFPIAEDVPSAELNAQIELAKAAKQVVQDGTPQTVRALTQARAALDVSRE